MVETYDELAETRKLCIAESPAASYSLRKEALMIRMVDGATRNERIRVLNTILAVIEENSFLSIDLEDHRERLLKSNETIAMFN